MKRMEYERHISFLASYTQRLCAIAKTALIPLAASVSLSLWKQVTRGPSQNWLREGKRTLLLIKNNRYSQLSRTLILPGFMAWLLYFLQLLVVCYVSILYVCWIHTCIFFSSSFHFDIVFASVSQYLSSSRFQNHLLVFWFCSIR